MDAIMVIAAVLAVFMLFQLYNVLGRKVGFKSDNKPQDRAQDKNADKPQNPLIKFDEPLEFGPRIEKKPEGPKIANLDQLKIRDPQFNETIFAEKAREVYEKIVLAFDGGDLSEVKDKLSDPVFDVFDRAIKARPTDMPKRTASFMGSPKADFDVIDIKDDAATIRMRFLSELQYEEAVSDDNEKPKKTAKRTAEFWTFQKSLKSVSGWQLIKVEAARA